MGVLQFILLWLFRRNHFEEAFLISFPKTDEERVAARSAVIQVLGAAWRDFKQAQGEYLKLRQKPPTDADASQRFVDAFIRSTGRSAAFEHKSRLARWAGFRNEVKEVIKAKVN